MHLNSNSTFVLARTQRPPTRISEVGEIESERREKVRYHHLVRAHRTDKLIQTGLLSAQLKLKESDRPVNVSENNITQTHRADGIKDSPPLTSVWSHNTQSEEFGTFDNITVRQTCELMWLCGSGLQTSKSFIHGNQRYCSPCLLSFQVC